MSVPPSMGHRRGKASRSNASVAEVRAQHATDRISVSMTKYLKEFPEEADRIQRMVSEPYPHYTPITGQTLMEEYDRRIEIIRPLAERYTDPSRLMKLNNSHMAILLTMPLDELEKLSTGPAANMFEVIPPLLKQFLHGNEKEDQSSASAAKRPISHGSSQTSSKRPKTDNITPHGQSRTGKDVGENSYQPTSSRNRTAAQQCKERDGYRCILTGSAMVQACHIIPYWWSTKKWFPTITYHLEVSDTFLSLLVAGSADFARGYFINLFATDPGRLDQPWNMLTLNENLHSCWGRAMFGFKLLGDTPSVDQGFTDVTLQYRWLGKSTAKPNELITHEMLNDPTKKILLDELDLAPEAYADFSRSGHMLRSGLTVKVKVTNEDKEHFTGAIRFQWALLQIAALCGAGENPDCLPDKPYDHGSGGIWEDYTHEQGLTKDEEGLDSTAVPVTKWLMATEEPLGEEGLGQGHQGA